MLRLSAITKLSPEEAVRRAVKFFGPEGYHLEIKEESETEASFEGGGGGVSVSASVEGGKTTVELASREWDYQIREFVEKIT
jgi:hypothetical protein